MSVTSSEPATEPFETTTPLNERLGGRWAISWPAFLIGSVLIVILITLSGGTIGGRPVGDGERTSLLIASLAGVAGIGLVFWIGHLTLFRRRHEQPVSIPATIGLHLLSGAVFGVVLVVGSTFLGVESDLPAPVRITALALAALWWCLTMSLLLHAAEQFTTSRRRLIDDAVGLELAAVADNEVSTGIRAMTIRHRDDIDAAAAQAAVRALNDLNNNTKTVLSTDEWWGTSASLRDGGDGPSLREEFQRRLDPRVPIPGLLSVLREVVTTGRFAVLATAIVVLIVTLPHSIVTSDPLLGVTYSLALSVAVGAILAACNILLDRLMGVWHVMVYVLSLTLITALVTGFIAWPTSAGPAWDDLIAAAVVTVAVLIASSSLTPLDRVRSRSLSVLRDRSSRQRAVQRQRMLELSNIARSLATSRQPNGDGDVTARLHACATGLQRAAATDDVERWRHALEWSAAIVDASTLEPVTSVAAAIDRALSPWVGFLDVDIDLADDIGDAPHDVIADIEEIASQALRDASRRSTDPHRVTIQVRRGLGEDIVTTWDRAGAEYSVVTIEIPAPTRPA